MKPKFDTYQKAVIYEKSDLLVIAGPGSGKTTTILEKVHYLLQNHISEDEIILISFTNKSVQDIKERLNQNIYVTTFHKLAIDILNTYNYPYKICPNNLLDYIIDEFFKSFSKKESKRLCRYLNITKLDIYSHNYHSLKNLIKTFIFLYKTNNYNKNKLIEIINNQKDRYLIKLIITIFSIYEEEKKGNNYLDFDDLIITATDLLKTKYIYKNFKYIIVDEFQDTSQIRFNLIKEIKKNCNSILTAVGDDAQSIFHFSGCDINIFLNFQKYFPNSKVLFLKNTYRNSQELIDISSKFINKNKRQIKKNMISNTHIQKPIIYQYYKHAPYALKKAIDSINSDNIMIISRNKKDLYLFLDKDLKFENNFISYKNKTYKYLTIHSSKGLESDYVIILNVSDSLLGIPNKLENHPIINYLSKDDSYPYAEERRVFFVGLTRCKYQTYLLIPKNNPSKFIKELKKL